MNLKELIKSANPFSRVFDLADKAIPDKDLNSQLKQELDKAVVGFEELVYQLELNTKTIPWVDAIHKMGRQVMSYLGYGLAFYMVHKGADPWAVGMALTPGGIYSYLKGQGK